MVVLLFVIMIESNIGTEGIVKKLYVEPNSDTMFQVSPKG
jgi:hypothetical protein